MKVSSPEDADAETIRVAVKAGELRLHTVDFDCLRCKRSFDYKDTKRLSPASFVLAHLKSCRLSAA